jgi:hypothetical protein
MSASSQLACQSQKRLGGATGKWWKPGQSGNAGGRPKAVLSVQELARAYTEQAVRALVEALADPRLRVQAAVAILDRAWGRPVQAIAAENGASLSILHLVAAREISERIQQAAINGTALPPADDDTAVVEQTPNAQLLSVDLSVPALE